MSKCTFEMLHSPANFMEQVKGVLGFILPRLESRITEEDISVEGVEELTKQAAIQMFAERDVRGYRYEVIRMALIRMSSPGEGKPVETWHQLPVYDFDV